MKRFLTISYGVAAYFVGFAAFLYAIGFLGNFVVSHRVDDGVARPVPEALVVNLLLLAAFGVQHSLMARPSFKRWWTRIVPPSIERSTYVLATGLVLALVFWQWRPMLPVIWDVSRSGARIVVQLLFWLGWVIVLASTFMINHFDLFGLRQVYLAWRGRPYTDLEFRTPLLYRVVRHPLMLGFLVVFWASPRMTLGHLLFALVMTGYILFALRWEERDLTAALGRQYSDYRSRVPMLIPRPRSGRAAPVGRKLN
ncbi:methanethiol S-methyltransferase [Mycobacterium asiaticum]|uniref:methanethiol S-methyltransferase n=1 Tax=Mycobacterium asiaticum TaxID=1790 RepID=A0A1A3MY65_MYCAS|nr:methanethiol S-methyltransferase [Mycobacterium asiaticum]OBK14848.1 hypothetical protein A5636_07085 [Mycobacterium asiaticum]